MSGAKSCFISGADSVSALRGVLADLHVRIIEPDAVGAERPLTEEIRAAIASVDFVCAALSKANIANALIEIGIAIGLQKPILIFVDELSALPAPLQGFNVVEGFEITPPALRFHLELFVKNLAGTKVQRHRTYTHTATVAFPLASFAPSVSVTERTESMLERQVADVFRRIGCNVVLQPEKIARYRPDMAIWLNADASDIGNQILVEVQGRPYRSEVAFGPEHLQTILEAAHIRTGFLITAEAPPGIGVERSEQSNVFIIPLVDLVAIESTAELVRLLRRTLAEKLGRD